MADNAFTRSQQKENLIKHVESQQMEVNLDYSTIQKGDEHVRRLTESVQTLTKETKNLSFKEVEQQLADLFKVVASSGDGIDDAIKNKLLNSRTQISAFVKESEDALKSLRTTMKEALKFEEGSDEQINAFKGMKFALSELNTKMEDSKHAIADFKDEINKTGYAEAIKSITELNEVHKNLDSTMKESFLNTSHPSIAIWGEGYKFLREEIKKTADDVSTNAATIIANTLAVMNNDQGSMDTGTTLMFKQLQAAVQGTGSVVSVHGDNLVKTLTEMGRIAKGEAKNVDEFNKSIENQANILTRLGEVEKDFTPDKLKGLSEKDIGDKLNQMQTLYKGVYDQIAVIVSEMDKMDPQKKFSTQVLKDFASAAGEVANKMRDIEATQRSMGYNDGPIQAPSTQELNKYQAQIDPTRKKSVNWSNIGREAIDIAQGGSKFLLGAAGLGNVASASGIMKNLATGVFNADKTYGNLEAGGALADLTYGYNPGGTWDSKYMDNATSRGYDVATRTHGMVGIHDYEQARQELVRSTGGHYGYQNGGTGQASEDMGKLAEMSTTFQKGYGVSGSDMNISINTMYKELNMSLNETEYAMGKIANQAQSLGVPFDKHLKQITALTMQYKEYGLSIDNAMNVTGNLMLQQHMNATDANRVAGAIGNGMSNIDEGMGVYMGMRYGGVSNPFEARMKLKNRWNSDGKINEEWAGETSNQLVGMMGEMKSMGGGDKYAGMNAVYDTLQKYMKMDDFSASVLTQQVAKGDVSQIRDLLMKTNKDGSISSADSVSGQATNPYDGVMKGINERLEQSSEHLSAITKNTNQLAIEAANMAKSLHDAINNLLDFSKGIHSVGKTAATGNMSTLTNSLKDVAIEDIGGFALNSGLLGLAGVPVAYKAYQAMKGKFTKGGPPSTPGTPSGSNGLGPRPRSGSRLPRLPGGKLGTALKWGLGLTAAGGAAAGVLGFGSTAHGAAADDYRDGSISSFADYTDHHDANETRTSLMNQLLAEEDKVTEAKMNKLSRYTDIGENSLLAASLGTSAASKWLPAAKGLAPLAKGIGFGTGMAGLAIDPLLNYGEYFSTDKDLRSDADLKKTNWKTGLQVGLGGLGVGAGAFLGGPIGMAVGGATGSWAGGAIADSEWFGQMTGTSKSDINQGRENKFKENQDKIIEEHQSKIKDLNTNQLTKMVEMADLAKSEGVNIAEFVQDKLPKNHQEAQALQQKIEGLTGKNESHLAKIADNLGLTFNQVLALAAKTGVTNTMYDTKEVDALREVLKNSGLDKTSIQAGIDAVLKNKSSFKDQDEMNIFATQWALHSDDSSLKTTKDKDNFAMDFVDKYRHDSSSVGAMKKAGILDKYGKMDDTPFESAWEGKDGFNKKYKSVLAQFAVENNMNTDNVEKLISKNGVDSRKFAYGLYKDSGKNWDADYTMDNIMNKPDNSWKDLQDAIKANTDVTLGNTGKNLTAGNGPAVSYLDSINKYSKQYGVDPNLVAGVIQAESSFNPKAGSPVGAAGLMQLMPGTARGMMGKEYQNYSNDDMRQLLKTDTDLNIKLGTQYLSDQLKKFGDTSLALAAYNAGPSAVVNAGNKIPNYKETQNYVPKVLAFKDEFKSGKAIQGTAIDQANAIVEDNTSSVFSGSWSKEKSDSGAYRPIFSNVGSQSVYGMGDDASWSAKGMYSGLISNSDDGKWNNQIAARESGRAIFNININADDPAQYEQMAKELEEMAKQVVEKFKREQQLQS